MEEVKLDSIKDGDENKEVKKEGEKKDEKKLDTERKIELVQLAGINGIRFKSNPISFIW